MNIQLMRGMQHNGRRMIFSRLPDLQNGFLAEDDRLRTNNFPSANHFRAAILRMFTLV